MTRSKCAFRFSVETLFDLSERPYFWTFTMRKVVSVDETVKAWNKLAKSLWHYGKKPGTGEQTIFGLRVFELHEGGHGLHIHCLLNRRIPIHAVRRRAEQHGFFWIDVRRVKSVEDMEATAGYLSEYLSKQARPGALKGRRLWQSIGQWGQSKCKNIVVDSEFAAAFRARRKVIAAETAVAEIEGRKYRMESAMETMDWARVHVHEVACRKREPLRPALWIWIGEPATVPDLDDWQDAFDALLPRKRFWRRGELHSELQGEGVAA